MNESVIAHVHALSHEGRGIASVKGKTTFIEGALPGETVVFTYKKRRNRFDEGVAVEVVQASADRVTPRCIHFSECGGCALQHMDPMAQIHFKQSVVLENLLHFGGVTPTDILPPILGPVYGYRRKARLGVKYVLKKGKVLVGFKAKNPNYLADIQQCDILHPSVAIVLQKLQGQISTLKAYQSIIQVEIAVGEHSSALVFRNEAPVGQEDRQALKAFGVENQIAIYLQSDSTEPLVPLHSIEEDGMLKYRLSDANIAIQYQPTDFTQVNFDINQQMVSRVIELLALEPTDRVLDLFCGLGNFSLPIARFVAKVVGIEANAEIVKKAYQNALSNKLMNIEFYASNLQGSVLDAKWVKQSFNKVLLDPPRTGALEILPIIHKGGAYKIVYVSCNPATFARDIGELVKKYKFTLGSVGVLDMFPQTTHVESIAVLTR